MPRRTRADSDATAAEVLRTALELFGRDGYAAVGLDAVAAAAGVTRGAVYHHYGSKAGLFERVVAAAQAEVGAAVAQAASRAGEDPWAAFEAGCRAFLEHSLAAGTRRIVLVDGPSVLGWSTWRDLDAAASGAHLADAVEGLAAAGVLTAPSVPAMTALLSGAMNEAALWVAGQDDRGAALEEAWASLAALVRCLARDRSGS